MSSVSVRPEITPRVSGNVFLGFLWAGTSLAGILLAFRLTIRYKMFKTLKLDDALVIFSWILLLITAILYQLNLWRLYEQYAIATVQEPFREQFIDDYAGFAPLIAVCSILFYTSLWSIKISFLLFFRQLGSRTKGFQTWWWVVFAITVCCCIPCIADFNWKCSVYPIQEIFSYCITSESIIFNNATVIANCCLDLLTDVLIISIPIIMLWPVRLRRSHKIILMSIFSASIVVMIFAIVRVAVIINWNASLEVSWMFFWTNMEMAFSIMIACVASFRQSFVAARTVQDNPNKSMLGSRKGRFLMPSNWRLTRKGNGSRRKWPGQDSRNCITSSQPDRTTDHVPLTSIHVRQDSLIELRDCQDSQYEQAYSEHS